MNHVRTTTSKILVTGGAGYIGSTVASALRDAGIDVVVLDDLSRGNPDFLRDVPHVIGDIADNRAVDRVFAEFGPIDALVHCAGRIVVPESVADPSLYYRENVVKTIAFVDAVLARGCQRIVFSSSASVYGDVDVPVVTEESPLRPASPYARTKVIIERYLADLAAATPVRALTLRYFNPVGCDPQRRSWPYDPTPTHALGSLLRAWQDGKPFYIHGDDWPTPDGTPVRDFVHVWDVALAHVAALRDWQAPSAGHEIVNVGSGRSTSVRELAEAFNRIAPRPVLVEYDGRRAGDTAGCHTSTDKALRAFGWRPQRSVDDAIADLLALEAVGSPRAAP